MNQHIDEKEEQELLEKALHAARDTKFLRVESGVRHQVGKIFLEQFPGHKAILVADANTFAAAGKDVKASFQSVGLDPEVFLFPPEVYAEYKYIEQLEAKLTQTDAIAVAIGSGSINDLTKLTSHHVNRRYMIVGTAASMDGYSAYGASITYKSAKQTFDCPAPYAAAVDLEVVSKAPEGMNASGYADLLAKNVSGADWIVSDLLGVEALNMPVWNTVQSLLTAWVGDPKGIRAGNPTVLHHLAYGLMMSGFAMQAMRSSRPASGADHQFSHLWDMQHHTYQGKTPSHGFKVGIGTLSSLAMYDYLLRQDLSKLDIDRAVAAWPTLETVLKQVEELFGTGELSEKVVVEMKAKYVEPAALRKQLECIRDNWSELRKRLEAHLIPFAQVRQMLADAGCPSSPEEIGISRDRLRKSYTMAYYIRRRFTVLDLAQRTGLFDQALDDIFSEKGLWGAQGAKA